MTFLRQIQLLLERTYAPAGINLETCLISRQRYEELSLLAGSHVRELGEEGRTFLRIVEGRLHMAIYFHPSVIAALENHHPLSILNSENIRPLIVFIEELDHGIHAALRFLENELAIDSEETLCDLELQAKVDTYLTLEMIGSTLRSRRRLTQRQRMWFQECLFKRECLEYENPVLKVRYGEANRLGLKLVRHLDRLDKGARIGFIRDFRPLCFKEKRQRIATL